jgi:hypothetical protein
MGTAVSAAEWPVFDRYEIMDGPGRHRQKYVGPAEGATIRERLDFTVPSVRREALEGAMVLTKRKGDAAGDLVHYAERFGLFGVGIARILHAVQVFEDGRKNPEAVVYRLAGQLRTRGTIREERTGIPSLDLEKLWCHEEEEWSSFCRPGVTQADMLGRSIIGSDEWWSLYVEPVETVYEVWWGLFLPADHPRRSSTHPDAALEATLADTYVRLPTASGPPDRDYVQRGEITFRSVSALGALAFAVTEGVLDGWRACDYELCRRVFKPGRSDQRFCEPACRDKAWKRARYQRKTQGGGDDG